MRRLQLGHWNPYVLAATSMLDETDSQLQWLSLLSSRFYGRITNHPEATMKGTEFSNGGACEYEVSVASLLLL